MGVVDVLYGKEAREKMNVGAQKLVKAVASTLGANGNNVTLVDNLALPQVTKDGVTVARKIRLYDYVENAGADIIKLASVASADIAGDGSSTVCVLAGAMLEEGLKVPDNSKMFEVREGMRKAVNLISEQLEKDAFKIDGNLDLLKSIATTSANNDEKIGDLIANTVFKLGLNAPIIISRDNAESTYVEETMGYTYDKPLVHHYMTQIEGDVYSKIENPKLLVIDDNLNDFKQVVHIISYCIENDFPLVIMANVVGNEFLKICLTNIANGKIDTKKFAVVETPNYNRRRTESLRDIVKCSGAKMYSLDNSGDNLADFKPEDLGSLDLFIANDTRTTFKFTAEGEQIAKSICGDLEKRIEEVDITQKNIFKERINRLSRGTATIFISAKTATEHSEMYDLYEDSLKASMSALEEGVVDGGGLALLRAVNHLSPETIQKELLPPGFFKRIWLSIFPNNKYKTDEEIGMQIVYKACLKPFELIVKNSGVNYLKVFKHISDSGFKLGYDAKKNEITSMLERGILDPRKVTRVAVESALSASTTILTTNTVIYPHDFEK